MTLFEVAVDPHLEYGRGSTPHIDFLDRSPRPAVAEIREVLDLWYGRFPDIEKDRLKREFRSTNNRTHSSAFFELYCNELLLRHGYEVSVHVPEKTGRAKDFRCRRSGRIIDFEATVSNDVEADRQQNRNRTRVLDYIDEHGFVLGFRYSMEDLKEGSDLPRLKHLAHQVRSWASENDRKTLRRVLETEGPESLPVRQFVSNEWKFRIRLIPKPEDELAKPSNPRSISMGPITSGFRNDDRSLRNTLKLKSKHYRDKRYPFIIGVNANHGFGTVDEEDILSALLGTEVVRFRFKGIHEMPDHYLDRKPDGLWIGPKGPTNKTVGGVMIVSNLAPWSIVSNRPVLFIHPFSSNPVTQVDLDIDAVSWDTKDGEIVRSYGRSPAEIFDLPEDWPIGD